MILKIEACTLNNPPALPYKGFSLNAMAMVVPPTDEPVPTTNCCSSPMLSPASFVICSFTTPSVSVLTFRLVGICLYAPALEKAFSSLFLGVPVNSTFAVPPPPKVTHGFKSAGLMSGTSRVNWNVAHTCAPLLSFSAVLKVSTAPLLK